MKTLKNIRWSQYINYAVIGILTIVFSAITLAGGRLDGSVLLLLEKIAISIILAVSLSVVVGFLGELSLGHAGFMCVGAYLGGKLSVMLEGTLGNTVPSLIISLLAGGLVAAIFGVIIGIPALRLRGDYLAIVTLAFGEIVRSVFLNSSDESFGGTLGLETPRFDRKYLFIFAFLMVLLTLFVVQNFIKSKHGRAVTAIRDNEIAARATGINVTKYKLLAFVISAFFAGIAGVLFSHNMNSFSASGFDYNTSILILVYVVLGGIGSIRGSVIAAILLYALPELLREVGEYRMLFYAILLIVMMIVNNNEKINDMKKSFMMKVKKNKTVSEGGKN